MNVTPIPLFESCVAPASPVGFASLAKILTTASAEVAATLIVPGELPEVTFLSLSLAKLEEPEPVPDQSQTTTFMPEVPAPVIVNVGLLPVVTPVQIHAPTELATPALPACQPIRVNVPPPALMLTVGGVATAALTMSRSSTVEFAIAELVALVVCGSVGVPLA